MNRPLSQSDRDFLADLNRSGPRRVQQLCDTHGVTPNAVRHRLNRLLADGFIDRTSVPSDRGRPFHEYSVTNRGQQALGNDYSTLARLLWREVIQTDDPSSRERVLLGLRQALVARYQPETPAESLRERFDQLRAALDREGFEVETTVREDADLPVLREHACPYHELAAEDRSICELEQSVFAEVVGVPVVLTQCCHDGHSCCEFEPAASS